MNNFKEYEEKWQKYWEENKIFEASNDINKKKCYLLVEFPYPSGTGMHLGHIKAYSGLEVIARKRRIEGYNVLFPLGFDAFGLPTENSAIKQKIHPRRLTDRNIKKFLEQLKKTGFSFDLSRVIDTTDEKYYKWTQWIFLKMFEKGLVFRNKTLVNYCPSCKVILSNEDSQGGKCDICHSEVIQKEKDVWYLRITAYADKLLEGLKEVDYPENIKLQQENWIGKSTGAFVSFKFSEINEELRIYTTRPDTIYGVTFMVMAPEHPLLAKYKEKIKNYDEVEKYKKASIKKTEFERTQLVKEKTGVKIEGLTIINPVNNKELPIYISDYVMMGYGTGAIMAVPAHDERDYQFAKKFNIDIIPVIKQITGQKREDEFDKNSIVAVVYDPKEDKYLTLNWGEKGGRLFIGGTLNQDESAIQCAKREIEEETGYSNIKYIASTFPINHHYYAYNKNKAYNIDAVGLYFELIDYSKNSLKLDDDEVDNFKVEWVDKNTVINEVKDELHFAVFNKCLNPTSYIGSGIMINSGILNGIDNKEEAINKITDYLVENDIGEKGVQYKMKDWAFNRQRYWGEPIPIIHCKLCGAVPVPYEELPLKLPEIENFEPGSDGESPLAKIDSFVNCTCPKCGGPAKRETDTMPQWAGSSWYFLRYIDPSNYECFAKRELLDYFMPVDWYNGGMEHVTRHVIYSRFWYHFLYDLGLVPTKEPYAKRTYQGLILGIDGEKMSKSKGNVIDPLDIVEKYGADVLRCYILFMGDYSMDCPWNDDSIKGVNRFIQRVINLKDKLNDKEGYSDNIVKDINRTVKKVSEDYENMKYNTAIASMMILVNTMEKEDTISKEDYRVLLTLLNPISPHVTEELNEICSLGDTICRSKWPTYDSNMILDDEKEIAVQVNGKLRGTINININDEEEIIKQKALNNEGVKKHIANKEIVKIIVIKDKIVNIVIK